MTVEEGAFVGARRFGDRATFAVEVGDVVSRDLRVVDVWAAGTRLTTIDNTAYVPSLRRYMRLEADRVQARGVVVWPYSGLGPQEIFHLLEADKTGFREHYWFMHWNEIFDNLARYAYLDGDELVMLLAYRRGAPAGHDRTVFVATLPADEFAATVRAAADMLDG